MSYSSMTSSSTIEVRMLGAFDAFVFLKVVLKIMEQNN